MCSNGGRFWSNNDFVFNSDNGAADCIGGDDDNNDEEENNDDQMIDDDSRQWFLMIVLKGSSFINPLSLDDNDVWIISNWLKSFWLLLLSNCSWWTILERFRSKCFGSNRSLIIMESIGW